MGVDIMYKEYKKLLIERYNHYTKKLDNEKIKNDEILYHNTLGMAEGIKQAIDLLECCKKNFK